MSNARASFVFWGLMAIAVAFAFVIPHSISTKAQGQLAYAFAPVSLPTRGLVGWAVDKLWPASLQQNTGALETPQGDANLLKQNEQLRAEVAWLSEQLKQVQVRAREREQLGSLLERCLPYSVAGADSGTRQTLNLIGSSLGEIKVGQAVLQSEGAIIGRISRAAAGGAQVQLLTDPQSRLTATFGRFQRDGERVRFDPLPMPPTLIVGAGRDEMMAANVPWKQVQDANLQPGDWVVLDDADWPSFLKGYRVAVVKAVRQNEKQPLFAEISLSPIGEPSRLREVLVVVK
jgi:cell shape-determining protein MreC